CLKMIKIRTTRQLECASKIAEAVGPHSLFQQIAGGFCFGGHVHLVRIGTPGCRVRKNGKAPHRQGEDQEKNSQKPHSSVPTAGYHAGPAFDSLTCCQECSSLLKVRVDLRCQCFEFSSGFPRLDSITQLFELSFQCIDKLAVLLAQITFQRLEVIQVCAGGG